MMQFNDHQRRFLQDLGRTDNGRQLVQILNDADAYYSSISTIDTTKPADAQIEGRQIFSEFIKHLTTTIETQKHRPMPIAQDDFT